MSFCAVDGLGLVGVVSGVVLWVGITSVLPNPPLFRWVWDKVVVCFSVGVRILWMTSCAILSPVLTVNGVSVEFLIMIFSGPR